MTTETYESLKAELYPKALDIANKNLLSYIAFNTRTQGWTSMIMFDSPKNRETYVMFYFERDQMTGKIRS